MADIAVMSVESLRRDSVHRDYPDNLDGAASALVARQWGIPDGLVTDSARYLDAVLVELAKAEIGPLEKSEPPAKVCGHRGITIEKIANPAERRVIIPYCDSWDCKICGPRLKRKHQDHFKDICSAVPSLLHLAVVAKDDWCRTEKRLSRQGAAFLRFDLDDCHQVIVTTGDIGRVITRGAALLVVEAVIDALPFDRKRISTSRAPGRDWTMSHRNATTDPEWRRVPLDQPLKRQKELCIELDVPFGEWTQYRCEGAGVRRCLWYKFPPWWDQISRNIVMRWQMSDILPSEKGISSLQLRRVGLVRHRSIA